MATTVSFKPVQPDRIAIPKDMSVTLSDQESQLCQLLDEFTQQLEQEKGIKTSCRIAGGWVRDKLLNDPSHDIDIALSDMKGFPFATDFIEFASTKSLEVKPIHKVKENPDQSKHLETATTSVLGLDLDFVNLRAEEYADSSRIPTKMTFGTPLQDAQRRDTTINALFYNVHTRLVEDHCGTGLEDLRAGIIRTPLAPRQTFLDDPLRVIRCVRFASRFGFDMVPELIASASDPEIQTALTQKISRERVGEEIDKMMSGRNPLHSIYLIDSLDLFTSIFHIPPTSTPELSSDPAPSATAVAAASVLYSFLHPDKSVFPHRPLHPLFTSTLSASTIPRLYLACALTPYAGVTYTDSKGHEKLAVEAAIREGLKSGRKNHYEDGIPELFQAASKLRAPRLDSDRLTQPSDRVAIGLLLRDPVVHNPSVRDSHWTSSLLFSLVQELVQFYDIQNDAFDVQKATTCIEVYNTFVRRVVELDLVSAIDAKPILDGRAVVQTLELKPGPWTAKVLADVVKWQLAHPDGTREQCVEWLKAEVAAGSWAEDLAATAQHTVVKRAKGAAKEGGSKKNKH
ncbi:hypothetical protein PENSPDRAFT_679619 [Peniophora sp. CONT]|nr:hypothetical protein PENSPDRAFT_679619 [Peniophora sp. CONT]